MYFRKDNKIFSFKIQYNYYNGRLNHLSYNLQNKYANIFYAVVYFIYTILFI